jgi:uncharacterized protein (DUF779 family)
VRQSLVEWDPVALFIQVHDGRVGGESIDQSSEVRRILMSQDSEDDHASMMH